MLGTPREESRNEYTGIYKGTDKKGYDIAKGIYKLYCILGYNCRIQIFEKQGSACSPP
jgi:hypothetical protein